MAEDQNKFSREDIAKLEKAISDSGALLARQEEILKKVLDSEIKISETRIAGLEKFFDKYSKNLDSVIAKKTSKLSDAYLILERQAAKNYAAATSEFGTNKKKSSKGSSGGGGKPPNTNNAGGNSKPAGRPNGPDEYINTYQTISDDTRAGLDATYDDLKNKADQWAKFFQQNEEERRNVIESERAYLDTIEERRQSRKEEQLKEHAKRVETIEQSIMDLEILRHQKEEDRTNQATELRLARLQESLEAEISAQSLINRVNTEREYSSRFADEAGETRARRATAEDTQKTLQQLEERRLNYINKKELEAKRKNNGVLRKEEAALIQKQAAEKFKVDQKNLEKLNERRIKLEAASAHAAERAKMRTELDTLRKAETFEERKQALYNLTHDESGDKDVGKAISAAMLAVSDLAKQLEGKINEIASHKGFIDTRLQGSSNKKFMGSYWDQLVRDMTSVGAINPYFKQENYAANIEKLVDKGIAFDLKQRAFLMTIQDKIANTFEVADGTLLRLVRIQQQDSTAGRLGMESALNSFLNEMYETSEYLSDVAKGVRNSLEEMQALMEGAEATEVEYQVQKWLGSLYSVGMSQNAVQGISSALGQIAAGQIEGLTNGGAGNLLIMAANDAGLSIADILTDGINSSDTNKLLQAAVNYLAELSDSAKDNKVVQQQLADVFGVKASDLRAATNLVLPGTTSSIYGNSMTYDSMLSQLSMMAGSMHNRTSIAEMMSNIWENGQYSLAGSMASNPVSYFIYNMAKVLDNAAGGIDLPFVNVMGFGVDLNTTVSDLMRVAAVGAGILGSIGPMVSGLGSSFSGQAMLQKLGINSGAGLAITPRGDGNGLLGQTAGGNRSTSGSGYVGNASGSDIKNSTIQEAEDTKKQQMIEAKEEEEANQVNVLNTTVLQIYEILNDVVNGDRSFKVKVEGYGLTKAGGGSSGGAQGGLGGVLNNSGSSSYSVSGGGTLGGVNSGSVNSGGVSGSVDFGGWTTI